MRAALERTRGDVTMAATQGRVERALRVALGAEFAGFGLQASNDAPESAGLETRGDGDRSAS